MEITKDELTAIVVGLAESLEEVPDTMSLPMEQTFELNGQYVQVMILEADKDIYDRV